MTEQRILPVKEPDWDFCVLTCGTCGKGTIRLNAAEMLRVRRDGLECNCPRCGAEMRLNPDEQPPAEES